MAEASTALFDEAPLSGMVAAGAVDSESVRLWIRSGRSGTHLATLRKLGRDEQLYRRSFDVSEEGDHTHAVTLAGAPLAPMTDYEANVRRLDDGEEVGSCRFRTPPRSSEDTPGRVAFGVFSCHQPFDASGRLDPRATRLLDLAGEILSKEDVSRVIMMGDQVYSDLPAERSLFADEHFSMIAPPDRESIFDCTRQEVRELFHRRYRSFWSPPAFRALQSSWACDMILDDHEIIDNFGSAPDHATPRYRALRDGALDAYYDYQASRSLPPVEGARPTAFYRSWLFGTVAAFMMDLRSERRHGDKGYQVYSSEQLWALRRFLDETRHCHVVMIGLSVPLLHVPDWIATAGARLGGESSDAADRWSHEQATDSRDQLLGVLRAHQVENPQQRIVLLGGDVHVGLISRLYWANPPDVGDGCMLQVVSSAITNRYSPFLQRLASLAPRTRALAGRAGEDIVYGELLGGVEGFAQNPFGGLNLAVVEVWRDNPHLSQLRVKLYSHSKDDPPRPEIVFDSGML